MASQVMFEADFVETRSRLSTFFRLILAIPLIIWGALYSIAVGIAVVLAWFALLFTGRYPAGLYNFVAGFLRFSGRAAAYIDFLTDQYPPFGGNAPAGYPVRVDIAPPLQSYGRWRVFLRVPLLLLGLLAVYLAFPFLYVFGLTTGAPSLNWFVILNDGKARRSLHRLTWMGIVFQLRLQSYIYLMAQDFPPFFSEWPRTAAVAGAAAPPPAGS